MVLSLLKLRFHTCLPEELYNLTCYMRTGDHIYVWRDAIKGSGDQLIRHHGIYCGSCSGRDGEYDDWVIDLDVRSDGSYRIEWQTLRDFSKGREVKVWEHDDEECFDSEIVIKRAKECLGEGGYNLFGDNCEHFANWCKTGYASSEQAERGAESLGRSIGKGIARWIFGDD